MQEISKVSIDLLFCLILGLLLIQTSQSASHNEGLINSLSLESARISLENFN